MRTTVDPATTTITYELGGQPFVQIRGHTLRGNAPTVFKAAVLVRPLGYCQT